MSTDTKLIDANARARGYTSNAAWMLDSVRRRGRTHREIAASLRECGYLESADAYDREAEADEAEARARAQRAIEAR